MHENLFELASEMYDVGNYTEAFTIFLSIAERGDVGAMTRVAIMYGAGEGVIFDLEKSVAWDEKAVQAGSITSLINLGITYQMRGDIKKSKYWFERAVDAGDCEAAFELAKLYLISEKEVSQTKHYLKIALAGKYISEASREEAEILLAELKSDK